MVGFPIKSSADKTIILSRYSCRTCISASSLHVASTSTIRCNISSISTMYFICFLKGNTRQVPQADQATTCRDLCCHSSVCAHCLGRLWSSDWLSRGKSNCWRCRLRDQRPLRDRHRLRRLNSQ